MIKRLKNKIEAIEGAAASGSPNIVMETLACEALELLEPNKLLTYVERPLVDSVCDDGYVICPKVSRKQCSGNCTDCNRYLGFGSTSPDKRAVIYCKDVH